MGLNNQHLVAIALWLFILLIYLWLTRLQDNRVWLHNALSHKYLSVPKVLITRWVWLLFLLCKSICLNPLMCVDMQTSKWNKWSSSYRSLLYSPPLSRITYSGISLLQMGTMPSFLIGTDDSRELVRKEFNECCVIEQATYIFSLSPLNTHRLLMNTLGNLTVECQPSTLEDIT